jgi:hypothetical protein
MTKVKNRTPGFRRNDSNQPYFEGYYFKFINEKKELIILIAGISISKNEKYSFIQLASNFDKNVAFYKFPLSEFKSSKDSFLFSIGNNTFKRNEITLNLEDISLQLQLKNSLNWNRSALNPNIMGFLSFIPKVECKHDIITVEAEVTGSVEFQNRTILFDKSRGYIEKNWGYSFPKKYLWLHANQFKNDQLSLQFAMAKPKWLIFRPQVYIGYLMNGRFIHFGSHRLSLANVKTEGEQTSIKINKFRHSIKIRVTNRTPINLISPKEGKLQNEISEYLNSTIELTVLKKKLFGKNKEIINDISRLSTTEVHNESQNSQKP